MYNSGKVARLILNDTLFFIRFWVCRRRFKFLESRFDAVVFNIDSRGHKLVPWVNLMVVDQFER
jgi:hypothetical protein